MRLSTSLATLALLSSLTSGCVLESLDPVVQFREQVHQMSDEMRWARIDLASERVSADYRQTFLASHRLWGSDIRIANAEATNITLSEDASTAIATVEVSWYDERTMEVYGTIVHQHFINSDNGYLLNEETIAAGDDGLLLFPEEDETAGGEEEEIEG